MNRYAEHTLSKFGSRDKTEIAEKVREAVTSLAPDKGVIIIEKLSIQINYASGGGATVKVSQ